MNTLLKYTLLSGTVITLVLSGCRKDKEIDKTEDNSTEAAKDNNLAERSFDEVKNITDAAASGYMGSTGYKGMLDTAILGCATVIHDTTVSPRTLSIDYGPSNCLCGDGRYRRGKINVSYTGPYRATGTVITHTFDNFFINDNQILGTKTVTNAGLNTAGNMYFNIDVNGSIVKAGGAGTITWTSTRVREWIAGSSTWAWNDDVYSITGTASGTRADGTSFTANITSPVIADLSCIWRLTQGTIEVTPSGKPVRVINYGSGACDSQYTVTVSGYTFSLNIW